LCIGLDCVSNWKWLQCSGVLLSTKSTKKHIFAYVGWKNLQGLVAFYELQPTFWLLFKFLCSPIHSFTTRENGIVMFSVSICMFACVCLNVCLSVCL